MTDSIRSNKQPPRGPRFKENDIVRFTKKIEDGEGTFKKGSVGVIGDVQVSALTGDVGYEVVIYNKKGEGKSALVDPEDIVPHNPANRPQYRQQIAASPRPPAFPADLAQAPKEDDKV